MSRRADRLEYCPVCKGETLHRIVGEEKGSTNLRCTRCGTVKFYYQGWNLNLM